MSTNKNNAKGINTQKSKDNFIYPFEGPKSVPETDKSKYNEMTVQERREYLKNNAEEVKWKEMKTLREKAEEFERDLVNNPMLGSDFANTYLKSVSEPRNKIWDLNAARVAKGSDDFTKIHWDFSPEEPFVPTCVDHAVKENIYRPKRTRTLITSNITMNKRDKIPVFCDIPLENLEELQIPESLAYEYGNVNRINSNKEKELVAALKEAEKEENTIRCDCHEPGKPVQNCWENKNCPCYKANIAMRSLKKNRCFRQTTKFATQHPVLISSHNAPFLENVGFACSSSCGCRGHCDNNVLHIAETRMVPLEVFRRKKEVGFELRSPVAIQAGTLICEFTGDIQQEENMNPDDKDYAYRSSDNEDKNWIKFAKEYKKWTPEYTKLLAKMHSKHYYCNPKIYGNVGRTMGHACAANVEVLRVFQKSLSPAHVRLVMVSLVDIFPGTPLTLDYGTDYFEAQLANVCECRTVACPRLERNKVFLKFNYKVASACLKYMNDCQRKFYMDTIRNAPKAVDDQILVNLRDARKRKREEEAGPARKQGKLTPINK